MLTRKPNSYRALVARYGLRLAELIVARRNRSIARVAA